MPMTATPQFLRVESPVLGRDAVDRENRIIRGVVVAEEGAFKTRRRGQFTQESLSRIVELGSESDAGSKSRLTHPQLSEDGIGTNLGRVREFRKDGPRVLGDLHFNRASSVSPDGDLADFVMTFAEDDPEAFGMSMVVRSEFLHPATGEQIDEESLDAVRAAGFTPIWMPVSLHAVDVVDSGDATTSFLSAGGDVRDSTVRYATSALDRLFSGQSRDVITQRCETFLSRYLTHRFGEEPMSGEQTNTAPAPLQETETQTPTPAAAAATPTPQSDVSITIDASQLTPEQLAAIRQPASQESEDDRESRAVEILEICQLAGVPERAAGLIKNAAITPAAVREQLMGEMSARRELAGDATATPTEPADEWATKWTPDYQRLEPLYKKAGITLEQYLEKRKEYDKEYLTKFPKKRAAVHIAQ